MLASSDEAAKLGKPRRAVGFVAVNQCPFASRRAHCVRRSDLSLLRQPLSTLQLDQQCECDYNVITLAKIQMRIELVRIGNSRGIRIPKPLIEQCGFGDTVELHVEQDRLIIAPERPARQGWKEAFAAAGSSAHDPLPLDALPSNEFDSEEWTW
jgi:antitoxin MazE